MNDNLKKCPFCGNDNFNPKSLDPVIVTKERENIPGYGIKGGAVTVYRVKCFRCTAQGGPGVTGYNALTDSYRDEAEARQIAIDNWNLRRNHDENIRGY